MSELDKIKSILAELKLLNMKIKEADNVKPNENTGNIAYRLLKGVMLAQEIISVK